MTHDEAFLQAIREAPDDDGPRLVYADWLEDHGQAERAEFIRVQCERARRDEEDPRAKALHQRAGELLQAHWEEWVEPLRKATLPLGPQFGEFWLWRYSPEGLAKFRRGFVDTLTLGTEEFLTRVGVLARLLPLRGLVLRGAGQRAEALAAAPYLDCVEMLVFADYFDDPLKTDGARALAGSPYLGRLRWLVLARNDIADAGMEALAAAPWLRGLRQLDLDDNGLSDVGVRALAASSYPTRLRGLNLAGNSIGDPGAAALAASPYLGALTVLDLAANRALTAAGREVLRQRFGPHVSF
jgi:uncharacterized protein (TIGR02996 family)